MGKMSLRFFGGDVCALKDWQEEDDTVLFTISNFVAVDGSHVTWTIPIR